MTYRAYYLPILMSLALASIILSLSLGSVPISSDIIITLRLPRTLTAFTVGGLLALAGALMQLLLQNPLADPYALGVSGGSALGVLLLMLAGVSGAGLVGGAWAGSLIAISMITFFANKCRWQSHTLLLSGIALACGFSACISFILLISPDNSLHNMLYWLSGDLNDAEYPWLSFGILCTGGLACWLLAPGFNILTRGEQAANALGLPCQRYKLALYVMSSLFTAAAVSIAGCVGFIGLIVPHLVRMLFGFNHRLTLLACIIMGGTLLTLADTIARSILAPQQLPVGIMTAFIGIPIFIWLLSK